MVGRAQTAVAATIALAAIGHGGASAAPAVERPWTIAADLGAAIDLTSIHPRLRGGLALRRALGWKLEGELRVTLDGSERLTSLGTAACLGVRLGRGRLAIVLGWSLGATAIYVHDPLGSLLTAALTTGPSVALRWRLGERLELHAALLEVTFLWNELWNVRLDPGAGIGLRF
jgi:hypothetical protein